MEQQWRAEGLSSLGLAIADKEEDTSCARKNRGWWGGARGRKQEREKRLRSAVGFAAFGRWSKPAAYFEKPFSSLYRLAHLPSFKSSDSVPDREGRQAGEPAWAFYKSLHFELCR